VPPALGLYFPMAHDVQFVCPVDAWYVPDEQLVQTVAPEDALNVPTAQASQDVERPVTLLKVPGEHSVHAAEEVDPVAVLYVPTVQLVQTVAPVPAL
jgi:hypothetical protein